MPASPRAAVTAAAAAGLGTGAARCSRRLHIRDHAGWRAGGGTGWNWTGICGPGGQCQGRFPSPQLPSFPLHAPPGCHSLLPQVSVLLHIPVLSGLSPGASAGRRAGEGQGAEQEVLGRGQQLSRECCFPAPQGASRFEPCLCPSFLRPLEAPAQSHRTPPGWPWSQKTSVSSGLPHWIPFSKPC